MIKKICNHPHQGGSTSVPISIVPVFVFVLFVLLPLTVVYYYCINFIFFIRVYLY